MLCRLNAFQNLDPLLDNDIA